MSDVAQQSMKQPRLVIRAVGETWDDAAIAANYGMGSIGLGLGYVQPVFGPFALDVEFTYKRLREGGRAISADEYDGRYLQLLPVSAVLEYRLLVSRAPVELFAGAGPALVIYTEDQQRSSFMDEVNEASEKPGLRGPDDPEPELSSSHVVIRGARPSWEARAGVRIDTGLIQPPNPPAPGGPIRALDVEIYVARRFTTKGTGFNLNTWRASVGLGMRF